MALDDLDAPAVAAAAQDDRALADRAGIDAAPTFLAGPSPARLAPIRAPDSSPGELTSALDRLTGSA